MSTRDHYYIGEDGKGRYRGSYGIGRDLERLHELTDPFIAEGDNDLGQAVARIPDETQRHEAGELLSRLTPVIGPHVDAINAATQDPGDGLHSA